MIKSIIFDLDGTLVDSIPDINASVNKTLEYIKFPSLDIEYTKKYVGNGAKLLINRVLNHFADKYDKKYLESIENDVYNFYIDYYSKHCTDTTRLYDNVLETLERLYKLNISMFIISNKPNKMAINTAKNLNIYNYFRAVIGDGIYPYRKPDVNVWHNIKKDYNLLEENTLMVGDGIPDYEFAKNANIKALIALYGITDKQTLLNLKNDYYINNFKEVEDFVLSSNK